MDNGLRGQGLSGTVCMWHVGVRLWAIWHLFFLSLLFWLTFPSVFFAQLVAHWAFVKLLCINKEHSVESETGYECLVFLSQPSWHVFYRLYEYKCIVGLNLKSSVNLLETDTVIMVSWSTLEKRLRVHLTPNRTWSKRILSGASKGKEIVIKALFLFPSCAEIC